MKFKKRTKNKKKVSNEDNMINKDNNYFLSNFLDNMLNTLLSSESKHLPKLTKENVIYTIATFVPNKFLEHKYMNILITLLDKYNTAELNNMLIKDLTDKIYQYSQQDQEFGFNFMKKYDSQIFDILKAKYINNVLYSNQLIQIVCPEDENQLNLSNNLKTLALKKIIYECNSAEPIEKLLVIYKDQAFTSYLKTDAIKKLLDLEYIQSNTKALLECTLPEFKLAFKIKMLKQIVYSTSVKACDSCADLLKHYHGEGFASNLKTAAIKNALKNIGSSLKLLSYDGPEFTSIFKLQAIKKCITTNSTSLKLLLNFDDLQDFSHELKIQAINSAVSKPESALQLLRLYHNEVFDQDLKTKAIKTCLLYIHTAMDLLLSYNGEEFSNDLKVCAIKKVLPNQNYAVILLNEYSEDDWILPELKIKAIVSAMGSPQFINVVENSEAIKNYINHNLKDLLVVYPAKTSSYIRNVYESDPMLLDRECISKVFYHMNQVANAFANKNKPIEQVVNLMLKLFASFIESPLPISEHVLYHAICQIEMFLCTKVSLNFERQIIENNYKDILSNIHSRLSERILDLPPEDRVNIYDLLDFNSYSPIKVLNLNRMFELFNINTIDNRNVGMEIETEALGADYSSMEYES